MANFAARRFTSSTALLRPHRVSTTHVQTTSGSLASSLLKHNNNNNNNHNNKQHHHDSLNPSASRRHISSRPSTNMGWPSSTMSTTPAPVPGVSILASPAMRSTHPAAAPASFTVPTYPCTKSAIARAFKQNTAMSQDRAFAVNDVGVVERQYARWVKELPRVHPFYAVKCNPDENLLKVLAGQGAGFDVASGAEMESALAMGVSVEDIIFANPIKSVADLRYARKVGVKKMTFDNEAELLKIKEHFPEAELVMRLLPDDSGSVMRFGIKFGTPQPHIRPLLELAQRTNMRVIGTSFHIGSGCFDAQSYAKALKLCREVFDLAAELGMTRFHYLDIGGGFPGNPVPNMANGKVPSFETMASVIRDSLDTLFNPAEFPHLRIIGEPGRYMATAWSTLFVYVQGKREEPVDPSNPTGPRKFLYYVNDGVYGSFNCIMFDHAHPEPIPAFRFMSNRMSLADKKVQAHAAATNMSVPMFHMPAQQGLEAVMAHRSVHSSSGRDQNTLATFFGPTCDSMDCLAKDFPLEELFVGDWVAFEHMGAYTNAAATTFNGMPKASATLVRSKHESPFVPVA